MYSTSSPILPLLTLLQPSISTQVTDGTFVDTASFPVIEPAGNDAFTTGPQISKRDDVELDPPQQVQVPAEVALQSRDVCTTASQPAKLKKKFWSTKKNPSFAANLARGQ